MQTAPDKLNSEDVESLFDFLEDDQQADAAGPGVQHEQKSADPMLAESRRPQIESDPSEPPLPIIRKPVCVSQTGPLTPPKPGDPVEPPPPLTDSIHVPDNRLHERNAAEPDFSDIDGFEPRRNAEVSLSNDDWPSSESWVDTHSRPMSRDYGETGAGPVRVLGYTLGVLLTAAGVSSAVYSVTPARQWVDNMLQGRASLDGTAPESNQASQINIETEKVNAAIDRSVGSIDAIASQSATETLAIEPSANKAPASLNEQFRDTLANLESLMEQGAYLEAETVLSTMDLAVYGYGAPEFKLIEEQIIARISSADLSADAVAVTAEEARLAEQLRSQEEAIMLAEQARRIEAERLAAEEQARQIEAERVAVEQARQIEVERLAAEEQAARVEAERQAAELARQVEAERLAAEQARQIEAQRLAAEQASQVEAARIAAEQARQLEAGRLAAVEQARLIEVERQAAEAVQQAVLDLKQKAAQEQVAAGQQTPQPAAQPGAQSVTQEQVRADRIAQEQARQEQLALAQLERDRTAQRLARQQASLQVATPAQISIEQSAAVQREAAENKRLLEEARQRQEQTALSQAPVPSQPNRNVAVVEDNAPASKSITDSDLQLVYGQFAKLQSAIQSRDINAVLSLTEKSGTRIQQVMQMFENNVTIDARLRNVSTLDSTGEIQGTLQITRLERADGSVTGPPFNLGLVRLTSSRDSGGWSKIRW